MKLRKKIKRYISLIVTIIVFIQPLFLQFQLISAHQKSGSILNYEETRALEESYPRENETTPFLESSNYYIDVAPERLGGLNLRELIRIIVEDAYATDSLHELPQGLINCYIQLEQDALSLYVYDLAEALPVAIEKLSGPIFHTLSRAPRVDAPGADNAIVGPLINCDISKALQALNNLLNAVNKCCAELKFDFNGVFSLFNIMLSVTCDFNASFSIINTNFNGTFSVLQDIENTLTTCCAQLEFDFDGTFSSIADAACDLTAVFSLVNINFNQNFSVLQDIQNTLTTCCANLEFDFEGTFTTLENLTVNATCDFTDVFSVINTNFNATFTSLDEIKNTVTTCCAQLEFDFNGTFTVLENLVVKAECDFTSIFSVVDVSFNSIFSVLTDIQDTLTTCCAELQFDFDGTFSVLATLITSVTCDFTAVFTLATNFEGTFTIVTDIQDTLTTCCAGLEFDFDGTFSVLANLRSSVTCDFTAVFTLATNFEGTFTILNDIQNTLSVCCGQLEGDLEGTFTALSNFVIELTCDFVSVFTVENANVNATYSIISDIKNTVTVCCAQLKFDFDGTFSTFANPIITTTCDFSSIFTTLQDIKDTVTTCCAILEFDFDGTFSSITNLMVTASCDLVPIFTVITDIEDTVTACCNNFNNTFTALSDIKDTVTTCCAQLDSDFDGTFTSIASLVLTLSCDFKPIFTALGDIKNTVTICCAQLDSDFDGTFSVIANLSLTVTVNLSDTFTVFADIKNTFTACCATIQEDFNGTFSTITAVKSSFSVITNDLNGTYSMLSVLTAEVCNPTIITQANFGPGGTTPFVISSPGVYIFAENITFNPPAFTAAIVIAASGVTLDLQCFTLKQGNATANVDAIRINSGLSDVTVKNGIIANFTRAGISVQNNNLRPMIQNVTCISCAIRGIELLGSVGNNIQDAEIDHCMLTGCCQDPTADAGLILQRCNSSKISSCDINSCGTSSHDLFVILADTCDQLDVNTVNIFDNIGNDIVGIQLVELTRSSFENCFISSNTGFNNLSGIALTDISNFNIFKNCRVVNSSTVASFFGIFLDVNATNNMFINSNISWNMGGNAFFGAIFTQGTTNISQNSFLGSIITGNTCTISFGGIDVISTDAGIIEDSIISHNVSTNNFSVGIFFDGGNNWSLRNNLLVRNTGAVPAISFGINITAGANNLFILNAGFNNGGVGSLPVDQLFGVPPGSRGTPPPPETSNLNFIGINSWNNAAIAA